MSDVIDGLSMDTPPPTENDPTARYCAVCNALLPDQKGPGRKATKCEQCKTSPASARKSPTSGSTRVVTEALGSMDGFYTMAEVALLVVSANASVEFTQRRAEAQTRNKAAFESNKRLAENVAKMGRSSGMATFALAQVYLVAPAIMAAQADMRARRAARVATESEQPATEPNDDRPSGGVRPGLEYFL